MWDRSRSLYSRPGSGLPCHSGEGGWSRSISQPRYWTCRFRSRWRQADALWLSCMPSQPPPWGGLCGFNGPVAVLIPDEAVGGGSSGNTMAALAAQEAAAQRGAGPRQRQGQIPAEWLVSLPGKPHEIFRPTTFHSTAAGSDCCIQMKWLGQASAGLTSNVQRPFKGRSRGIRCRTYRNCQVAHGNILDIEGANADIISEFSWVAYNGSKGNFWYPSRFQITSH